MNIIPAQDWYMDDQIDEMRLQCARTEAQKLLTSVESLSETLWRGHEGWLNVNDNDVVEYYDEFVRPAKSLGNQK